MRDNPLEGLETYPVDNMPVDVAADLQSDWEAVRDTLQKDPITMEMYAVVAASLAMASIAIRATGAEPWDQVAYAQKMASITRLIKAAVPGATPQEKGLNMDSLVTVFNSIAYGMTTGQTTGLALPPM